MFKTLRHPTNAYHLEDGAASINMFLTISFFPAHCLFFDFIYQAVITKQYTTAWFKISPTRRYITASFYRRITAITIRAVLGHSFSTAGFQISPCERYLSPPFLPPAFSFPNPSGTWALLYYRRLSVFTIWAYFSPSTCDFSVMGHAMKRGISV